VTVRADAHYILGHNDAERRRLHDQAMFMADLTRRFLVDTGIRPGMRILDVGAGFGDVSFLAATITGPTGAVVGVEREAAAVERANARADAMGLDNVSFVAGDLRDVELGVTFDAIIGRFVLMYVADPASAIASTLGHLRPGGIVAFQEWHPADPFTSAPPAPLWLHTGKTLVETFRRAGTNVEMGLQLRSCFTRAGLPSPTLRAERLTGGGATYVGYAFLTGLIRSILPMIEHYGVAPTRDLDVDTLEDRLREEAVARDATVAFPSIVSAWTRSRPGAACLLEG
jgi:SAM-dependent methyltransferase